MSKKLAAGSDAIVLDVKCGRGAFMKDLADAEELSRIMCEIGTAAGRKTIAVITDMSQPLGNAVGNSLEVIEAIDTLKGKGPSDITRLSETIAGAMTYLGGRARTMEEGTYMARQAMASGAGLEKLRSLIAHQGGDPKVIDDYDLLPSAAVKTEVTAGTAGYVQSIDAELIGIASQHTGAGRATKDDKIDFGAGILLHKKAGDRVGKGEELATVFSGSRSRAADAAKTAISAFVIGKEKPEIPKLIKNII